MSSPTTQGQLRQGRAVAAAALLMENFQDSRDRGGFDREVFPEIGIPGKGGFQVPGVFPDALLVVDMEGGRILSGDGFQLRAGGKGCFHW